MTSTTTNIVPLTLLPFQEQDVKDILSAGGSGIIASEVGAGKTLEVVEVARRLKLTGSALIIAPPRTHRRVWERTIKRQMPDAKVFHLGSGQRGKSALTGLLLNEPGFYLCSAQWFVRRDWKGIEPDFVAFDEIHIAGNAQGKTSKVLRQLRAKNRIALSGTPLRNKFENAWSIVNWVWPKFIDKPFWTWRVQDCATKYSPFAPQNREVTGELHPGKLVNSLPCYIQHLQRGNCCKYHPNGFLPELDSPEEIIETVELTPAQRKFYRQLEDSYVAWLTTPDDSGQIPVVASLPIVARGMLRFASLALPSVDQETGRLYFEPKAESPKFEALTGIIEDMGQAPALILTHSQQYARLVTERLNSRGISAFEWSGKITQKRRDDALEDFISGKIRYIVAVISAIGTGSDGLQEATNVEIWLSESDDGTDNQQARGRLDRRGQEKQVVRIKIQAEGTYDEGIVSKQIQDALKMNESLRKKVNA